MPATKYPRTGGCHAMRARASPPAAMTIATVKSFNSVAVPSEIPAAKIVSRTSIATFFRYPADQASLPEVSFGSVAR